LHRRNLKAALREQRGTYTNCRNTAHPRNTRRCPIQRKFGPRYNVERENRRNRREHYQAVMAEIRSNRYPRLSPSQIRSRFKQFSCAAEIRRIATRHLPLDRDRIRCGSHSILIRCRRCRGWEITQEKVPWVICGHCCATTPMVKKERFRGRKQVRRNRKA
jgi:hypothetical protein